MSWDYYFGGLESDVFAFVDVVQYLGDLSPSVSNDIAQLEDEWQIGVDYNWIGDWIIILFLLRERDGSGVVFGLESNISPV